MSDIQMSGKTVTIPLELFNQMAACFYGSGPSLWESKNKHLVPERAPDPDGETESLQVREKAPPGMPLIDYLSTGYLPRPGFEPQGIIKKRLQDLNKKAPEPSKDE